ncbi:Lrp/AsnC family transcriptional regulator [Streptomyces sp. V4I23]|uniref:Lrp/AsnC family transcriptional regulator n=1 Tax=Streptomyces sp. V4I23 TaxID=3042282 RepID=UPI0027D7DA46|nr:AsnC family transcriptional regulator [Streptomyces sp. V4I23]
MDGLDREILGVLREDARISYRDLGVRVGLSANAAADRVRRMVRDGTIRGFTTIVDPTAGPRPGLVVFIDITLRLDTTNEEFERSEMEVPPAEGWGRVVLKLPGITEVVHVTGAHDYLVRATAADAAELDALLRTLKREAGVAQSSTRIALRDARAPAGGTPR